MLDKDNNFIGLFVGQLVLIFTTPFLHYFDDAISGLILHSAFISMIIITVIGNKSNRLWYKSIIVVAGLEILLFVLSVILDSNLLTLFALSLSLLFLILSVYVTLFTIFTSYDITINQLVGASCVYLLLGTIWAILYSNIFYFWPASFNGISNSKPHLHFADFIYFSFVTLTTLGYGDITPASPFARALTFMQAVTGQLYLTIMVAGLVGKAINTHKAHQK